MKTITESDFINLANNCVGTGLLATGNANFQLAQTFAKQQSIEFAKWIKENVYQDSIGWYHNDYEQRKYFTDSELYTQFTEHQTKQKK